MSVEAGKLADFGNRAAVPRKGRRLRAFLRNPTFVAGVVILSFFVLMALFADVLFPGDPLDMVGPPVLWPGESAEFPLGTDSLGRDVLAGLVHGARASLLVGLLESFSSFWASAFKEVIVFTLIIPVLLWRSLTTRHHEEED